MISRKENSCAALIEYQSNNHQKSFHPLKASDLDRLIQNQWIIDDVIKADILLMNQPKTYIIEPHAVDQILIKRKRTFTRNDFSKHEFLVGTLNQNNHWSLMFADLNRRLFFYLDPFVAKSSIVSKFFDSWKHFLQSREDLPKDNWRLGDFVHTKQSDNFNCGIIVLMMIRKLVFVRTRWNSGDFVSVVLNHLNRCVRLSLVLIAIKLIISIVFLITLLKNILILFVSYVI